MKKKKKLKNNIGVACEDVFEIITPSSIETQIREKIVEASKKGDTAKMLKYRSELKLINESNINKK